MNITRCDRCLKYLEEDRTRHHIFIDNLKCDLCHNCFLDFQQWLGQTPIERPRKRGCFG